MKWNMTHEGILIDCEFDDDVTELIIPDGVKAIREGVFQYCETLKTVIIPEGVTGIWAWAFCGCSSLSRLMIPETVTHIGVDAFKGTAWLNNYPDDFVIVNHILIKYKRSVEDMPEELSIPEEVYVISDGVFASGKNIKKLILPEGLKSIGKWAFMNCTALEEVHLPKSIETIDSDAFQECNKLKRVPLLVYQGKVFYRFPEEVNFGSPCAKYFLQNHHYELDLTPEVKPEAKYDLIFQMFNLNIDTKGTGEYIHQHFLEMIPILIRLNDVILMQKIMNYKSC